jgi:putative PIN family toxin of toxin-antitoxin system
LNVVLDVNVIISGLMFPSSSPGQALDIWLDGRFDVLTCADHIEELKRASRYPKISTRLSAHTVGRTVNLLKATATYHATIAPVDVSDDPFDNYLLALAQAGHADFLVTGDKAGLLSLGRFATARIVTARQFLDNF